MGRGKYIPIVGLMRSIVPGPGVKAAGQGIYLGTGCLDGDQGMMIALTRFLCQGQGGGSVLSAYWFLGCRFNHCCSVFFWPESCSLRCFR